MPRIRWNTHSRIDNKAVGLEGPEVSFADVGEEMTVSASALKHLEDTHGGLFVIVKEKAKEPPAKPGRGGKK